MTLAFRNKGHKAFSCDLLPTEGNSDWHIQGDVLDILNDGWDMMIAHPPCTYLANSGVQHLHKQKNRWVKMWEASLFFLKLLNSKIEKIVVENPVPHGYCALPKYDQIVQPYEYGQELQKKTCLWIKGLLCLRPTNIVPQGERYIGKNGKSNGSKWYQLMPGGKEQWKNRSRFHTGIANAMAEQWG